MNPGAKKFGLSLAAIVLLGAGLWLVLLRSGRLEPAPLPNPNGYDDFVEAGRMLMADPAGYQDASIEELMAMVASNAPAIERLRQGLEKESRVPLEFTVDEATNWPAHASHFKALARAMCAEARLELKRNRPDEAAETCVQLIRFGSECARGGVLIHRLVGDAIESMGCAMLTEVNPELDADHCKQIADQLEDVLDQREPLDEVRQTELAWSRNVSGFRDWATMVVRTRSLKPFRTYLTPVFARCEQLEADSDRLLLQVASRAYELEKAHPPGSATDLVPEYLKAVPTNPVTGKPMQLGP